METKSGARSSGSDGGESGKVDYKGIPFVPERGFYQPCTEDTWDSYQALLSVLEQQIGGYPRLVMCGVGDEVLSVLKCENKNPIEKRGEIEKQVGPLLDHTFDQLVLIGWAINDYYEVRRRCETDDRALLFVPDEGFYQPRTEETWTAYKLLLDVIVKQLGPQSEIELCLVAHDVLLIMKDETIVDRNTQKKMIEDHLYHISDDTFDLLVFISGLIGDFKQYCMKGGNVSQTVENNSGDFDQNPIRRSIQGQGYEVNDRPEFNPIVMNQDRWSVGDWSADGWDGGDWGDKIKEPTVDDIDFNIKLESEEEGTVDDIDFNIKLESEEEKDDMDLDQSLLQVDEEDKEWVMVDYGFDDK